MRRFRIVELMIGFYLYAYVHISHVRISSLCISRISLNMGPERLTLENEFIRIIIIMTTKYTSTTIANLYKFRLDIQQPNLLLHYTLSIRRSLTPFERSNPTISPNRSQTL